MFNEEGHWAEEKIQIAKEMALVVPNEFLFSLLYFMNEWKQSITIVKLCKALNSQDEQLIRDHLTFLLTVGLVIKAGEQYQISNRGRAGIDFLTESLGKITQSSWTVASAQSLADITIAGTSTITVNTAEAQLIRVTKQPPVPQDTQSSETSEIPVAAFEEALPDAA